MLSTYIKINLSPYVKMQSDRGEKFFRKKLCVSWDKIQFVSPDDMHDTLETWRELQINKYIEKNLCVKLDNCQEITKCHIKYIYSS